MEGDHNAEGSFHHDVGLIMINVEMGEVRWRPKRGPSRVGCCVCVWGGGRVLL